MPDPVHFDDYEIDALGNQVFSYVNFTEAINLEGSHYTISVSSTLNFTEEHHIGGHQSVSSSIDFGDTVTDERIHVDVGSLGLGEVVTGTRRTTITVTEAINFSGGVNVAPIVATVLETIDFTGTASGQLIASVVDSLAFVATINQASRVSTISVVSALDFAAGDQSAAGAETADALDFTESTDSTRTVLGTESGAVDLSEAVDAHGIKIEEVSGLIAFADLVTCALHATTSVLDEIDFDDKVRTSADATSNLWNNENGAAAFWSGLPCNSMVESGGVLYGAGPDGLYVMVVDGDDAGDQIRAEVAWDLSMFKSPQKKRFGGVYVSGAAITPFTIKVVNDDGSFSYKSRAAKKGKSVQHRAEPGRGLASVYNRISMIQTKPFAVDHVTVDYEPIARRIS